MTTERTLMLNALDKAIDMEQQIAKHCHEVERLMARVESLEGQLRQVREGAHRLERAAQPKNVSERWPVENEQGNVAQMPVEKSDRPTSLVVCPECKRGFQP